MLNITNYGGFLSLIYLWYNYKNWSINVNQNNILSEFVVSSLNKLPVISHNLIFIILILLYLRTFFTNKSDIILYFISLGLFNLLLKISLHFFMLEQTSMFFLFEITHPIPLNWKLFHFENTINELILVNKPELLMNSSSIKNTQIQLMEQINLEHLKNLNAKEITDYAFEIIKNFLSGIQNNNDMIKKKHIKIIISFISLAFITHKL